MPEQAHLRLVIHEGDHASHIGEVKCDQCMELTRRAAMLLADLELVEKDLRVERRRTAELKKKLEERDQEDDVAAEALQVYKHWKKTCRPKAKTFKGKRQEKVTARLKEGYNLADLCKAIDGAKVGAYVSADGTRYDDLELICRDATYVDRFIAKADAPVVADPKTIGLSREQRVQVVLAALEVEFFQHHGHYDLPYDSATGIFVSPCPKCKGHTLRVFSREGEDVVLCPDCNITDAMIIQAWQAYHDEESPSC